jgi:hypothetical protein
MEKAAFNNKRNLFTSLEDLHLRKGLVKNYTKFGHFKNK